MTEDILNMSDCFDVIEVEFLDSIKKQKIFIDKGLNDYSELEYLEGRLKEITEDRNTFLVEVLETPKETLHKFRRYLNEAL